MTERKRIAILGSTGSIGRQTLEVISWHPERFEVVGLAARQDVALFRAQVERFKPRVAALSAAESDGWTPASTRFCPGDQGLIDAIGAIEDVADASEKAGRMPRRIVLISDLQQGSRLDALGDIEWPSDVGLGPSMSGCPSARA